MYCNETLKSYVTFATLNMLLKFIEKNMCRTAHFPTVLNTLLSDICKVIQKLYTTKFINIGHKRSKQKRKEEKSSLTIGCKI